MSIRSILGSLVPATDVEAVFHDGSGGVRKRRVQCFGLLANGEGVVPLTILGGELVEADREPSFLGLTEAGYTRERLECHYADKINALLELKRKA